MPYTLNQGNYGAMVHVIVFHMNIYFVVYCSLYDCICICVLYVTGDSPMTGF